MDGLGRSSQKKKALILGLCLCAAWPLMVFAQQPANDGKTATLQADISDINHTKTVADAQPAQPTQPTQPTQPVQQPTQPTQQPESAGTPPGGGLAEVLQNILGDAKPGPNVGTTNVAPSSLPAAGDTGAVLGNTPGSGVEVQRRAPLAFDPRVRGYHVGQLVTFADWGFWTPARIDLDTALGKINPDNINNIVVIKGPYSVRYGPGFSFLDIQLLPTHRAKEDCFEAFGSTSLLYRTNGEAWAGRQYLWGGSKDWGMRLGYDILAGNDYTSGGGLLLPTSYNSHNVDFAIGFDLSECSSLELRYLRQMQNDVEFPGLLTDINELNTDGFSGRYLIERTGWFDKLTFDGWYNTTNFQGDSSRPGKRRQIPELNTILLGPPNPPPYNIPPLDNARYFAANGSQIRLDLETAANLYTWGFREAITWGEDKCVQLTLGADIALVRQLYNEFDSFNFSVSPPANIPSNFGIPATRSIDPGLFLDGSLPIGDCLTLRAGTRIDFVTTNLLHLGLNTPVNIPNLPTNPGAYSTVVGPDAFNTQHFFLWSGFGSADYKLNEELTLSSGLGFAQRPPLLTELYTGGAFFGLIQNGFNAIYGNPNLEAEKLYQLDLGLNAKYERFRGGANGFVSFVEDYITYKFNPFDTPDGRFDIPGVTLPPPPGSNMPQEFNLQTVIRQYKFTNTTTALLVGGELYAECDVNCWLTPFATAGYVQGRDLGIAEPLPGIAPPEGRVGVRVHDPDKNPRWAVEFLSRMVATQTYYAASLFEQRTGGFTVFNIRGYWQVRDNVLLTAGVENLADRDYQEHLDLRTGLGVYQPGINFYAGMKVNY